MFLYPQQRPATAKEAKIEPQEQSLPITIITDGRILDDNLKKAGKDSRWLQKVLAKENTTPQETFLLTVDGQNQVRMFKKDTQKRPS